MESTALEFLDIISCVSSGFVIAATGILWYNFLRKHTDDKEDEDG
jgi:hypothetical protein